MLIQKRYALQKAKIDVKERTFEGYASTWDKDLTDDIIHPGAFAKSIKEAFPAGRIKILWQHDEPLGMPTEMYEDSYGLFVKGRISKTRLGDEALELMKDGVVDRMSIGFRIPQGKADYDSDGIRHIREVKLHEFSPVTFPANEAAVITGVKNIQEALASGVEIEDKEEFIKSLKSIAQTCTPGEPCNNTHSEQNGEPSVIDTQKAAAIKATLEAFTLKTKIL